MRLLRSGMLLCLLLGLSTISGFGSSPSIIVNGDPPLDFTIITTSSFPFGSDPLGGGNFGFTNDTGNVWTKMDVLVTLPIFEPITCGSVTYVTCTVTTTTPIGSGPVTFDIIFGPNPASGITNMQNFTMNLNDNGLTNTDPNGAGSWGPDTDFTAVANAPEPASFALAALGLLTCCGLLFALGRSRAKALL